MITKIKYFSFLSFIFFIFNFNKPKETVNQTIPYMGAENFNEYLPLIKGKNVALIVNHTSKIKHIHLVDTLKSLGVAIKVIFAPEHGFRGTVSAGSTVNNEVDAKTGIKIISLYGNRKKPLAEDVKGIDYMIFDIQDVGVRFYTYISTMHYCMETAAENNIKFIVLDRPNPNGHYMDGPILEPEYKSFVGMHPIPIVHGLTVGELATMINGEKWLNNNLQCDLKVVKCQYYNHSTPYDLPINPSPNLQSQAAIYLYPSLALFEGTVISCGHGTDKPYQCFFSSTLDWGNFQFTPKSLKGFAENPKFLGQTCYGFDLTWYGNNKSYKEKAINLNWMIFAYKTSKNKTQFFTSFFEKLVGNNKLRQQIIANRSVKEIKKSWQKDLESYSQLRLKYLLYQ